MKPTRIDWLIATGGNPCFGIEELLIPVIAGALGGGELAGAAAPILADVAIGAAGGAGISAATGGNPGFGALTGGITGGAVGAFGPAIGEATGIGAAGGDAVAGAAGGAVGSAITGQDPLIGAAGGGGAGLVAGLSAPAGTSAAPSTAITSTPASGGAASAAGSAASPAAQTAAAGASVPLDPTTGVGAGAGGSGPAPVASGAGTSGGTAVDGAGAFGLNGPGSFGGAPPYGQEVSFGPNPPANPANVAGADFSSGGGGDVASRIMGLVEKNPGALLSGGLLGLQMLKGNEQYPAEKSIQQQAGEAGTTGRALSGYIFSGTLPPGAQTAVDQATNAAKATIRSRYAQMGLGGSTPEAEALQSVDRNAAAQTFQMADQLLQQGADYTKLSGSLYSELLKAQAGTDQELMQSLAVFAGGLGGLRGGGSRA